MKVVIIGASFAGCTLALTLNKNCDVLLLEKEDNILKKVLVTGNGRCNYMNNNFNIDKYNSTNIDILNNIINNDNKNKTLDFYNKLGIIPNIINDYYYPSTNSSISIQKAFITNIKNNKNIKIKCNYNVYDIKYINNKYIINNEIEADILVISGGSIANYNNKEYKYLDYLYNNYNINKLIPGLTPLIVDKDINILHGVRANVNLCLYKNNKFIKEEVGNLQFNKKYLSGICIFNLSNIINRDILYNKYEIHINYLYNINNPKEYLLNRLNSNISLYDNLSLIVNEKIVKYIFNELKININCKYKDISDELLNKLIDRFIDYKFNIIGYGDFNRCQVVIGGVSLKDIDINTFKSIKDDNLYIIGEVVDVDGICGGYNIAFATLSGLLSGEDINDKNKF